MLYFYYRNIIRKSRGIPYLFDSISAFPFEVQLI
jgi:hypothetical protein